MKTFFEMVTFRLIAINALVFFMEIFSPEVIDLFGLTPIDAIQRGMIWQFVTFMFVHGGFTHLFFNMFGLMMFGPRIEMEMGSKKFLGYYLICGVGSAFLHIFITGVGSVALIGASGAVFGVLTAYALFFPRHIIFFQFVPMPAIVFIIIFGALELVYGVSGAQPGIANFGHLGGMVTGLLLIKVFGFRRKEFTFFWE